MTTAPGTDEEFVDEAEEKQLFRFGSMAARSRSIIHTLLLLASAFVLSSVTVSGASALLETAGYTEGTAPVVVQLATTSLHFLSFLAVIVLYVDWQDDRSLLRFRHPTLRDAGWVVAGFLGLAAVLIGLDTVLAQFAPEPAENRAVEAGRENPELFLYFIPVVVLLNAPAEELFFRGLIQGLFRRAYGIVPGILAAAAVFGLVHWIALVGSGSSRLVYVTIAVASGLVLGSLYEYTDSLSVPIAVHACWNVFIYLRLYADTVGLP